MFPVALVAQQAFDAAPTDRRPTVDEIWDLRNALGLLLLCAAPDTATHESDAKATIQAIRKFTHHAISVFLERFWILVVDTNGKADKPHSDKAWRCMNWFIYYLRRYYQDEEFLPELVDGLAALIAQEERGLDRLLQDELFKNREWFTERKCELDERRKVRCLALLRTSHNYVCNSEAYTRIRLSQPPMLHSPC